MLKPTSLALAAIAIAAMPAQASISIATPASTYAQSFDSLTTSTSATAWVNDGTLAGWSLFVSTGAAAASYAADTGGSNAGTFRSYGAAGSSERALGSTASGGVYFGSPASGAVAGWIAAAFTNTSAAAFDSFTVGYRGEQWRNGGNTSAQTLSFQYGYGESFGGVANWIDAGAGFNFSSVVNTSTAAAVNGNVAGAVAGLGGTVATNWKTGQTLWLRWSDANDFGNDHGLAIDDFSLSVTAAPVPEPGSLAMLLAGLAAVGFVARRRA